MAVRVAQAREGVLVVSESARGDQVSRALDETAGEIAAGDWGSVFALRLEEVAYVWSQQGREPDARADRVHDARACLAAARAWRESPEDRLLLARAFVEMWLAPVLRDAPPKREEAPPLVVRP
jgi:hypothetical protein